MIVTAPAFVYNGFRAVPNAPAVRPVAPPLSLIFA